MAIASGPMQSRASRKGTFAFLRLQGITVTVFQEVSDHVQVSSSRSPHEWSGTFGVHKGCWLKIGVSNVVLKTGQIAILDAANWIQGSISIDWQIDLLLRYLSKGIFSISIVDVDVDVVQYNRELVVGGSLSSRCCLFVLLLMI